MLNAPVLFRNRLRAFSETIHLLVKLNRSLLAAVQGKSTTITRNIHERMELTSCRLRVKLPQYVFSQ